MSGELLARQEKPDKEWRVLIREVAGGDLRLVVASESQKKEIRKGEKI